jgi:ATP-dependent Clp protease ATP-binding subunit ClpC
VYERFTDRARKVMQFANQEAQRYGQQYISTEHILLGLMKVGAGVAANVLKNLDIDLRKIRLEVEKIVQVGHDVMLGGLPQTPRAKKVVEYSIEEARSLRHNYVGTEHLLLGLLRDEDTVASQILMNLGLKLGEVRQEILNLLGPNMQTGESAAIPAPPNVSPGAGDVIAALMCISGDILQQLAEIGRHIDELKQQKEQAVAEQDFEKGARLRDKECEITKQLLDAVTRVRALLQSPQDGTEGG